MRESVINGTGPPTARRSDSSLLPAGDPRARPAECHRFTAAGTELPTSPRPRPAFGGGQRREAVKSAAWAEPAATSGCPASRRLRRGHRPSTTGARDAAPGSGRRRLRHRCPPSPSRTSIWDIRSTSRLRRPRSDGGARMVLPETEPCDVVVLGVRPDPLGIRQELGLIQSAEVVRTPARDEDGFAPVIGLLERRGHHGTRGVDHLEVQSVCVDRLVGAYAHAPARTPAVDLPLERVPDRCDP